MDEQTILRRCPWCLGAGQHTAVGGDPPESNLVDCEHCNATGYLTFGLNMESSGIVATYRILEATNSSEYNALSDANKEAYQMIISCGKVDLTDGTSIRSKLWTMFGEGTTTRTNLEALVNG